MSNTLFTIPVLALTLGLSHSAIASEQMPVITSFSILGDIVSQIGGDHIAITNLVKANGDAHVYQPTPIDAKEISQAKLVIMNGLGFEGWMPRLIESSNFKGIEIIASNGITPLTREEEDHHHETDHQHGNYDPHAWNSVRNVKIYVKNIEAGLINADPKNSDDYKKNADNYLQKLDKLEITIHQELDQIPQSKRTIITPHDAFGYFSRDYNVTFYAPQGTSTESEASAADVATIIRQIRKDDIQAVFIENITDNRMIEQISNETHAHIGGKLYSDALSGPDEPATSYIKLIQHNVNTITQALK